MIFPRRPGAPSTGFGRVHDRALDRQKGAPRAVLRDDFPEIGIPENPALVHTGHSLWVAYEIALCAAPENTCAVVVFDRVIDHRLSPFNDEGLGDHPYAFAGLTFNTFHELSNSPDAARWSGSSGRHWILTFKDVTLDVIGGMPRLVTSTALGDPLSTLIDALRTADE